LILLFTFPLLYAKILKHGVLYGEDVRKLMTEKIHDKNTDFLFQAILALETPEECYKFFDDLCTVPELKAMSQRLAVAHMLSHKRVYSDIVSETGASTATISRVNRSLNYGSDGYELVFGRLDKKESQE
jgi:TrpR-related protein YerC/YecD